MSSRLAQWLSGKAFDLQLIGTPTRTKLLNKLGPVHTCVPLSPNSITWYWSKDGDVLPLGR